MANTALARPARRVWRREDRERLSLPLYSLGEGDFSAVSHGAAALSVRRRLCCCLPPAKKRRSRWQVSSVFGGTMILLYTVSTLYHALNVNRAKRVFRVLDHCTIFTC